MKLTRTRPEYFEIHDDILYITVVDYDYVSVFNWLKSIDIVLDRDYNYDSMLYQNNFFVKKYLRKIDE